MGFISSRLKASTNVAVAVLARIAVAWSPPPSFRLTFINYDAQLS